MLDRTVSALCVLTYLLWTVGLGLAVADLFLPADDLGHLGLIIVAVAAVLHVRSFFAAFDAAQRNAFELGRDAERMLGQSGDRVTAFRR